MRVELRSGAYLAALAVALWWVSWVLSHGAEGQTMLGFWYGFTATVGMLAAVASTVGAAIFFGMVLCDWGNG